MAEDLAKIAETANRVFHFSLLISHLHRLTSSQKISIIYLTGDRRNESTIGKLKDMTLQEQAAAKEKRERQENSIKAREAADRVFSGEKWIPYENGIYLSPNRPIGTKSNFIEELKDAQILRNFGSTVYLVPEIRNVGGKKYDAIVNGLQFEFKNVSGNSSTLETQFLRSRSQAPNVFINLDESDLTRRKIMATLYGARNKPNTANSRGYAHYNKFKGGKIILKIKGYENLIYLNVDDLAPL